LLAVISDTATYTFCYVTGKNLNNVLNETIVTDDREIKGYFPTIVEDNTDTPRETTECKSVETEDPEVDLNEEPILTKEDLQNCESKEEVVSKLKEAARKQEKKFEENEPDAADVEVTAMAMALLRDRKLKLDNRTRLQCELLTLAAPRPYKSAIEERAAEMAGKVSVARFKVYINTYRVDGKTVEDISNKQLKIAVKILRKGKGRK